MELEGLKRGLQFFAGQNLQVNSLVTDRHRSISKYMREDQSEIDHRYDVWHIAKGVYLFHFLNGYITGVAKIQLS